MKLFEYQAMEMLRESGIPVPHGEIADNAEDAASITAQMGGRSVIKAQVLAGGRGKAGGVKAADSPAKAREIAASILAKKLQGLSVTRVLVAERVDIQREYYMSVAVNRDEKRIECVFSASGGIDIEETAKNDPAAIHRIPAHPTMGISDTLLNREFEKYFNTAGIRMQAVSMAKRLYGLLISSDALLIEINPLAYTGEHRFIALDGKIIIDDNAMMKHPEYEKMRNPEESSRDEIDARNAGLSFVSLDGAIGCMVNGAGLAMATMDLIKHFGGEPANFLDVGGSSNPQKVVDALAILMRNRKLQAILMNIFGGITRCDDIARGVLQARKTMEIPVPFIIRLVGTNDELARKMLEGEGLHAYTDLAEAVAETVEAAKRGNTA